MSEGKKYDSGKPRMELLSTEALTQIAKVMGEGAKKYGDSNWRKGIEWSRVIGAAFRHLTAFNNGEDLDPETGISHVAHLACCAMFLLEYIKSHPELDDRYKPEPKWPSVSRNDGDIRYECPGACGCDGVCDRVKKAYDTYIENLKAGFNGR